MKFIGDDGSFALEGERVLPEVGRMVMTIVNGIPAVVMVYRITNRPHPGTLVLYPGISPEEFLKF